jgi:hypothetical protein
MMNFDQFDALVHFVAHAREHIQAEWKLGLLDGAEVVWTDDAFFPANEALTDGIIAAIRARDDASHANAYSVRVRRLDGGTSAMVSQAIRKGGQMIRHCIRCGYHDCLCDLLAECYFEWLLQAAAKLRGQHGHLQKQSN